MAINKIRLILQAGDIAELVGFKDIRTGDTFVENAPIVLESMDFQILLLELY